MKTKRLNNRSKEFYFNQIKKERDLLKNEVNEKNDIINEINNLLEKERFKNLSFQETIKLLNSGVLISFFRKYQNFIYNALQPNTILRRFYDKSIHLNQKIFLEEDNIKKTEIKKLHTFYPISSRKSILLITNRKLSGGSILFEKKWIFENEIENNIIVLDYCSDNKFKIYYKDDIISRINLDNYNDFELLLKKYNISSIFINQLAGISKLELIDYVIKSKISYNYVVHDFYCMSTYPQLINEKGDYLMNDPENFSFINSKRRREFWNLIKNAEKTFVPSKNTLELIKKVYPSTNLEINKSHEISRFLNIYDINKTKSNILEIGIIGSIEIHKGSKIIQKLLKLIEKENLPIKLRVIGNFQREDIFSISKTLEVMGHYNKKNLQNILKNSNISFILFPSIWPETFSYVCQESIELGYPILCFDLGSQVEKIRNERYGWKINLNKGSFGLFEKIKELEKNRGLISEKAKRIKKDFPEIIDIVMPVYNGFFYMKKAIQSIIKNSDIKCNLIIIEDCSTDKRVSNFLMKLKSSNNLVKIKMINNDKNLGFIKSVNKGLLNSNNHCIIINSDVIVPEKWLSRMIMPIKQDSTIASVTPYSNSATICSFPDIFKKNFVSSSSLDELDKIFREKLGPFYIEIPTGVGFCMLMNRNTINEIGYLDQETFERGYYEETDWTLRAKKAGWKNVHLQNLFVYHFEKGSFNNEVEDLSNKNCKNFLKKHPDYNKLLEKFLIKDPAKINRQKVINEIEKKRIII